MKACPSDEWFPESSALPMNSSPGYDVPEATASVLNLPTLTVYMCADSEYEVRAIYNFVVAIMLVGILFLLVTAHQLLPASA